MWLTEEEIHRKGAFLHFICLYAEGVFLYLLVRDQMFCASFLIMWLLLS